MDRMVMWLLCYAISRWGIHRTGQASATRSGTRSGTQPSRPIDQSRFEFLTCPPVVILEFVNWMSLLNLRFSYLRASLVIFASWSSLFTSGHVERLPPHIPITFGWNKTAQKSQNKENWRTLYYTSSLSSFDKPIPLSSVSVVNPKGNENDPPSSHPEASIPWAQIEVGRTSLSLIIAFPLSSSESMMLLETAWLQTGSCIGVRSIGHSSSSKVSSFFSFRRRFTGGTNGARCAEHCNWRK